MTRTDWMVAALLTLAIAPLCLVGLERVPFHPDESSLLYQSRDIELLLVDPQPLIKPALAQDARTASYRYLNAPLPKLVLALGRLTAGFDHTTVSVDWSWSDSWDENLRKGALPPSGALLGARAASALLVLLTVPTLYAAGLQLGDRWTAVAAAIIFGVSGLALLHGRRAMAEGSMLFACSLALLAAFKHGRSRPWLVGAAAGLAVAAKHSLVPVAVALLVWLWLLNNRSAGRGWRSAAAAGLSAAAVVWLMTPALWLDPIGGALEIVRARQALLAKQVADTIALAPQAALGSPLQRVASLIGHLFLLPLQYQEVGNYQAALAPAFDVYAQQWWLHGWRGPVGGGVLLALGLFGAATAFVQGNGGSQRQIANRAGLLLTSLLMLAALLIAVPLPTQRYYLPLLPMAVLWAGLGISRLSHVAGLLLEQIQAAGSGPGAASAG